MIVNFLAGLVLMQIVPILPKPKSYPVICHHEYYVKCNDCVKCRHNNKMITCEECNPKIKNNVGNTNPVLYHYSDYVFDLSWMYRLKSNLDIKFPEHNDGHTDCKKGCLIQKIRNENELWKIKSSMKI